MYKLHTYVHHLRFLPQSWGPFTCTFPLFLPGLPVLRAGALGIGHRQGGAKTRCHFPADDLPWYTQKSETVSHRKATVVPCISHRCHISVALKAVPLDDSMTSFTPSNTWHTRWSLLATSWRDNQKQVVSQLRKLSHRRILLARSGKLIFVFHHLKPSSHYSVASLDWPLWESANDMSWFIATSSQRHLHMIQSIVASPSWVWHELLWGRIAPKEAPCNQILDIALIQGVPRNLCEWLHWLVCAWVWLWLSELHIHISHWK